MSSRLDFTGLADQNPYVVPAGWTKLSGTLKIQGASSIGLLRQGLTGPAFLSADIPAGAGTQYSFRYQQGFAGGSDYVGAAFITPAGNGYVAYNTSTTVKIYPVTAFVLGTQINSTTITAPAAGDWFRVTFDINGSSSVLKIYQESVSTVTPVRTQTALTYQSGILISGINNWGNNNSEGFRVIEVDYGNPIIDTITPTPTIGDTVIITTSGLSTLTNVTVGGVSVSSISAPSGDGTFVLQTWSNGSIGIPLGTQYVIATDGAKTSGSTDKTIVVGAPTNKSFVQLLTVRTDAGYLGAYVAGLDVGAQVEFATAASLGVSTNFIDDDGGIYTDYEGTQTIRVRLAATGIINTYTITTSGGAVVSFVSTPLQIGFGIGIGI